MSYGISKVGPVIGQQGDSNVYAWVIDMEHHIYFYAGTYPSNYANSLSELQSGDLIVHPGVLYRLGT